MHGRRGNRRNFGILILFLLIFGGFPGISGILGILSGVIVPMVFIFALFTLYRALSRNNRGNQEYEYGRTSYATGDGRSGVASQGDTIHSKEQKAHVNAYLAHRFKNGSRAIEVDLNGQNVTLINEGGNYRTFELLQVRCQNRNYVSMDQFRRENGNLYNILFDTLLKMSRLHAGMEGPIIDADFTKAPAREAKQAEPEVVKDAAYFRNIINDLNNEIPDENISNSMYEMTGLLKQLHDLEKQFPASSNKLTKLYQTYLPYLIKILKKYSTMQHVETDPNYKKNEETLQRTINQINTAIRERLIPSMSQTASDNMAADMSTLEALLRKDGMTDDNDIVSVLQKQQAQTTAEQTR